MREELETVLERARAARAARPKHYNCPTHGNYASVNTAGTENIDNCPECIQDARAAEGAWRASWNQWQRWRASGVPARFANRNLDNWQPRTLTQRKALVAVKRWLEQTGPASELGALVLSGPPGLGKTHLCAGIALEVVRMGATVRYVAVPDLLLRLRASYDRSTDERPEDVLGELRKADLLILDEVAATRGTEWETATLSALVDDRYRDGGHLVIATNATPAELPRWIGERAADRLAEFALTLVLDGESYRPKVHADDALRSAPEPFDQPPTALEVTTTRCGEPRARTLEIERWRWS
jgi:DNA replication protein DnaC